jgi:hypothetical protein
VAPGAGIDAFGLSLSFGSAGGLGSWLVQRQVQSGYERGLRGARIDGPETFHSAITLAQLRLSYDAAHDRRLRDGFTTVAFGKGAFAQAWLASVGGRFFTSRVTRARREAAAALGADVISDPRVLLLRVGLAPKVKDPTARAVLSALLDSKWEFRTTEGIAKETRVPVDKVRSILDAYPQFVRQSPVPDRFGAALFGAHSAWRPRAPTSA